MLNNRYVVNTINWLLKHETTWSIIAWIVTQPRIFAYLLKRAEKTPYTDLPGYMRRLWLFNPYSKIGSHEVLDRKAYPGLPSVRIHHILRKDLDRHHHDHPWNARTIVVGPWYVERRPDPEIPIFDRTFRRERGYTGKINFGEFHTITEVPPGGVWTIFVTWNYLGTWGFLEDGVKVPWMEYKERHPESPWGDV